MQDQLLFFFAALGVFNGFLVSTFYLFFSKQRSVQKIFFGLLVLMLSIRIGKSVWVSFDRSLSKTVLQIGLSACLFIGPMLYFYLKSSLTAARSISRKQFLHIIVLSLSILIAGVAFPYIHRPDLWNTYFVKAIYSVWFAYLLASSVLLFPVLRKSKKSLQQQWWIYVWLGNLLIFLGFIFAYFAVYIAGPIIFTLVFYALTAFIFYKNNRNRLFEEEKEKYADKKISKEEADDLEMRIKTCLVSEKPYLNSALKIEDLSNLLNIKPHQMSQVLNDNLGISFNNYINGFRIAEAKKLIVEKPDITLEAIGQLVGFRSKTTFYAAFKKITGITPSAFLKNRSDLEI